MMAQDKKSKDQHSYYNSSCGVNECLYHILSQSLQ